MTYDKHTPETETEAPTTALTSSPASTNASNQTETTPKQIERSENLFENKQIERSENLFENKQIERSENLFENKQIERQSEPSGSFADEKSENLFGKRSNLSDRMAKLLPGLRGVLADLEEAYHNGTDRKEILQTQMQLLDALFIYHMESATGGYSDMFIPLILRIQQHCRKTAQALTVMDMHTQQAKNSSLNCHPEGTNVSEGSRAIDQQDSSASGFAEASPDKSPQNDGIMET